MLQEYLATNIFAFLLVFTRLGTVFMIVPGFGEGFVSPRVRLSIALTVSFLITQFVADTLPAEPQNVLALFVLLGGEILIGLIIGGALRLTISGLHVAGAIVAQQSGLAAAQFFDPTQMTQGAVTSSFLTIIGLTVIFVADLHHLFLQGTFASYRLFPVGAMPLFGDVSMLISEFVQGSFLMGFRIATPFLVYGLTFYIGIGLINRLMPQVQIFFVAMPLQILLGFAILGVTVGAGIMLFANYYETILIRFLGE